jgi:hypothetical protein
MSRAAAAGGGAASATATAVPDVDTLQRPVRLWLRYTGSTPHVVGAGAALLVVLATLLGVTETLLRAQFPSRWQLAVLAAYLLAGLVSALLGRLRRPSWSAVLLPRLDPSVEPWLARRRLAALERSWLGMPTLSRALHAVASLPLMPWLAKLIDGFGRAVGLVGVPKPHWAQENQDGLRAGLGGVGDDLHELLSRSPPTATEEAVRRVLDLDLPKLLAECRDKDAFDSNWLGRLEAMRTSLRPLVIGSAKPGGG